MKQQNLEQQVVAALTTDPPLALDQLLKLIAETEAGITDADTAAEVARAKFFDPVESPDINKARAVVEATEFTADRLRTLLPRLRDKAREVEAEADRQEWEVDFGLLADERDALAKELREVYPKVASQLVSLFARIADFDVRLSALHQSRPGGAKGFLKSTELAARQLDSFSRDTPSLAKGLRLPDWAQSDKLLWPPRELPASVMLAESIAATAARDSRRYSSEWPEALREETAARVAEEQQRLTAEAARTAQEKRDYEASLPR